VFSSLPTPHAESILVPEPVAIALLLASATAFLLARRARQCCGSPDTCERLQRHSPFLRRALSDPAACASCPHALPTLAIRLLHDGDTGYALAVAARALARGIPGASLVLARVHESLGNARHACALYRRSIAAGEDALAAWLALAQHHFRGGDYPEALRHFRHAAELDPSCAEAWSSLGRCHAALEEWGDAAACLEMSLCRAPDHLPTMHALGLVRVGAGDPSGALEVFERIRDLAGDSGPLLARLGRLARDSGDLRRAVVFLRDASRLSGLPDVRRDIAEVYAAMGQTEIAEFYRQEYEREYVL
jgi:tetratricopeptide (TPR) repeat protein